MGFSLFEISRRSGSPAELYLFKYGAGAESHYAYTNAERPITFNSIIFNPIPITRDSFAVTGTLDRQDLSLDVPHTSEIPELVRIYPPNTPVSLAIYQGHLDDPDQEFLPIWNGRVTAVSRKASTATITCQMIFTSLRRQGLRRNWQYGCPHLLYGPACRADKPSATTTGVVTALGSTGFHGVGTGGVNTISYVGVSGGTLAAVFARLVGGTLEFTNDAGDFSATTIYDAYNDSGQDYVRCTRPLPVGLAIGDTVAFVNGCDHAMTGCNLHTPADGSADTNIQNYGGQPWIPTKNPTNQFNAFY